MTHSVELNQEVSGYFILNFWESCSYADLDVLPVKFVKCDGEKEFYQLKKDNVIIGSDKTVCLI